MKTAETKYWDGAVENLQLYHDVGNTAGPTTNQCGVLFNPWANISLGTSRYQRIGDSITPRGMKLKLWLSNKAARPNVNYRIIFAVLPKYYNGAVTTSSNLDLFPVPQAGTNVNTCIAPVDKEKGIKVLYDKVFKIATPWGAASGDQFECSKVFNFYIKRKKSRAIKFDVTNSIVNNPMGLYIVPYDAWGSLQTDNIASCSYWCRLYYKDA